MTPMKTLCLLALLLPTASLAVEATNPWAARYAKPDAAATAPAVLLQDNTGDQFVTWKQVDEAVGRKLSQLGAGDNLDISSELADGSAKGDVARRFHKPMTLEVDDARFDASAHSWDAMIYFYTDGKPLAPQHLKGHYEDQVEVPVLMNRLVAGEAVSDENITTVMVPRSRLRANTVLEKSQLIGLSAKRGISASRAIRQDELAKPTVVKKGDRIALHFSSNGLLIKTVGEALQDGGVGELIRVKNPDSSTILQAVVSGAGSATVDGQNAMPQRPAPARVLQPAPLAAPAAPAAAAGTNLPPSLPPALLPAGVSLPAASLPPANNQPLPAPPPASLSERPAK